MDNRRPGGSGPGRAPPYIPAARDLPDPRGRFSAPRRPLIEITEVAPGVRRWRFWTRVSRWAGYDVSAYQLDGGLLVDSGFSHAWRRAADPVDALAGFRCALTHADEDHSGGAPLLAAHGLQVLAPEASLPVLRARRHLLPYQRLIWGTPRPVEAEPLPSALPYAAGVLEVVPTPGHAPDHVVFFDAERRWLFSGDLFIATRARLARRHEDFAQLFESLRRAQQLDPELLFDAHAGVVPDAGAALAEKMQWLRELQAEARRLREAGRSVREIRRRLLGREPWTMWLLTFGDFSKTNLIRGLLAAA